MSFPSGGLFPVGLTCPPPLQLPDTKLRSFKAYRRGDTFTLSNPVPIKWSLSRVVSASGDIVHCHDLLSRAPMHSEVCVCVCRGGMLGSGDVRLSIPL